MSRPSGADAEKPQKPRPAFWDWRHPLPPDLIRQMRLVHLYAGLALAPWVLLYGATALLFNHPTLLSTRKKAFVPAETLGAFAAPLDAEALRRRLTEGLANREALAGLELTGPAELHGRWFLERSSPERLARVLVHPGEVGVLHDRPRAAGTPEAWREAVDGARLERPDSLPGAAHAAALFERLAIPEGEVKLRQAPYLEVAVTTPKLGPARLRWELESGELQALPAQPARDLRSFFLRLHMLHGYPPSPGARLAWMLVVDAMAFSMVFWALSGLVMWWQRKGDRGLGVGVLGVSVGAGVGLVLLLAKEML